MSRFRDEVLNELILLEKHIGINLPSLRATYLRSQQVQLEELVIRFQEKV